MSISTPNPFSLARIGSSPLAEARGFRHLSMPVITTSLCVLCHSRIRTYADRLEGGCSTTELYVSHKDVLVERLQRLLAHRIPYTPCPFVLRTTGTVFLEHGLTHIPSDRCLALLAGRTQHRLPFGHLTSAAFDGQVEVSKTPFQMSAFASPSGVWTFVHTYHAALGHIPHLNGDPIRTRMPIR